MQAHAGGVAAILDADTVAGTLLAALAAYSDALWAIFTVRLRLFRL